jgi:uncharacterized membrane protein
MGTDDEPLDHADRPDFATGVVRPFECLRGGWELIRDEYWLFFGISLVGMLIAGIGPLGVLIGPMTCGIYLCLLRQDRGRRCKFDTLFQGFNYFLPGLVATLVMIAPLVVVYVGMYAWLLVDLFGPIFQGAQPGPEFVVRLLTWVGVLVGALLVVSLVTSTLFFFTYPLIVARKMGGLQALGTSVRAAAGNLGGVLGLVLLNMLLGFAGSLACGIGGLFVLPIHLAANIVAFRQVFGDEEDAAEVVED